MQSERDARFLCELLFTQVVCESFTYILSMVKRTWTSGDDVY